MSLPKPLPPQWLLEDLSRFFAYEHLPPEVQETYQDFAALALKMAQKVPVRPETGAALRKLLEVRDMFILLSNMGPKPEEP